MLCEIYYSFLVGVCVSSSQMDLLSLILVRSWLAALLDFDFLRTDSWLNPSIYQVTIREWHGQQLSEVLRNDIVD